MPVNLKDIADRVGVSISTVSRALNNDEVKRVKPSTHFKIINAAKSLGYDFDENIDYASRVNDNKNQVGIVLASPDKSLAHPFFSETQELLTEEIRKQGYAVRYMLSECTMDRQSLCETILTQKVSGVILLGRPDSEFMDFLKHNVKNLVYTGVNYLHSNIDEVICDGYDIVKSLYEHLQRVGCKSIGYIGPLVDRINKSAEHQRLESFKKCAYSSGEEIHNHHIQAAGETTEDGYTAMYRMLNSMPLPDGIICAADSSAIGAIRAAFEMNISIPKDIAMVGIDNIKLSKYLVPSLTTINIPKTELAKLAVNILFEKINNEMSKPVSVTIPHDILIRESCGFYKTNSNV